MMQRKTGWLIFLLFMITRAYSQQAQLNSSAIYGELLNLKETTSVLYIAAHPDDENTRLLTYLANGRHMRTAYLSLTRGDGGQNLIGDEQGAELGLIRTQELLAARKVDGTRQFFTRAVDFGYSKSAEETLQLWEHDSILADVVWVIRNFRPDIIITRFPPDERAGHGHHTASAMLAQEAFDLAANPEVFPEQLQWCAPWQPKVLFWNASSWWDKTLPDRVDNATIFGVEVGAYDPILGTSYGELAGKARSMHRSQGFGVSPYRGEQWEYLLLQKGAISPGQSDPLFVAPKWKEWPDGAWIAKAIDSVVQAYDFLQPETSVASMLRIYQAINSSGNPMERLAKKQQAANIIAAMIGLWAEPVVIGSNSDGSLTVVHEMLVGSNYPAQLDMIGLIQPCGELCDFPLMNNQPNPVSNMKYYSYKFAKNIFIRDTVQLPVAEYANATPYWLKSSFNYTYHVPHRQLIGQPQIDEIPLIAYEISVGGVPVTFIRGVVSKYIDPAKGEIYQPVQVMPAASVEILQTVCLFKPLKPTQVSVQVKALEEKVNGKLSLHVPKGWTITPAYIDMELNTGSSQTADFLITAPVNAQSGQLQPVLENGSKLYDQQLSEVQYDHIPVQRIMESAARDAVVLPFDIPNKKIGYIEGAGDLVDESLIAAGFSVVHMNVSDLPSTDLSVFDAIITGVRAYNVSDELIASNQLLLDYVKNGGRLIIQYNTVNNFTSGKNPDGKLLGPYAFAIGRQRTTSENSDVQFLVPEHVILNTPNKITKSDFEGWVQERGLYYISEHDEKYQFPIGFADPGEDIAKGAFMYAPYGEGVFMYTGISFFRQLPAGVVGAYKLMINMIAGS